MKSVIFYDVIVPVVRKNILFFLQYALPNVKKYLKPQRVILLGHQNLAVLSAGYDCEFVDENKIIDGMTLERVRQLIAARGGNANRGGWYFQQFLKMGWSRFSEQAFYLVWDADTIPLREIVFFDSSEHIFYNAKTEYHKPYFATINTLFSGRVKKQIEGSFISEHMMMHQPSMKKMLEEIEHNQDTGNVPFYQKIINAIPLDALSHSGFSEFETYGNWIMTYFPELYQLRHLKSMRQGGVFIGTTPTAYQLRKCVDFYDMISCEMLDKKRINVSLFMPFLTKIFLHLGIPMPRIITYFNSLKLFYYRKIRHEDIFIIE